MFSWILSVPEPLPHRSQQHRVPVKVEKSPLALCEATDVDGAERLDSHALQ